MDQQVAAPHLALVPIWYHRVDSSTPSDLHKVPLDWWPRYHLPAPREILQAVALGFAVMAAKYYSHHSSSVHLGVPGRGWTDWSDTGTYPASGTVQRLFFWGWWKILCYKIQANSVQNLVYPWVSKPQTSIVADAAGTLAEPVTWGQ